MLHVYALDKELGAALLQYQEGELRGVSFGSRTLTPAEKKYHSSKLELIVVKWVICNLLEVICIMPNTFIFTKKITLSLTLCVQENPR